MGKKRPNDSGFNSLGLLPTPCRSPREAVQEPGRRARASLHHVLGEPGPCVAPAPMAQAPRGPLGPRSPQPGGERPEKTTEVGTCPQGSNWLKEKLTNPVLVWGTTPG